MTKQTLLMTGATGLVGSRFVEMYDSKYDVHNADLTTGIDITSRGSVAKFVSNYWLKAGFLDGWRGLIYAVVMSIHSLAVRVFIYEQQQKNSAMD